MNPDPLDFGEQRSVEPPSPLPKPPPVRRKPTGGKWKVIVLVASLICIAAGVAVSPWGQDWRKARQFRSHARVFVEEAEGMVNLIEMGGNSAALGNKLDHLSEALSRLEEPPGDYPGLSKVRLECRTVYSDFKAIGRLMISLERIETPSAPGRLSDLIEESREQLRKMVLAQKDRLAKIKAAGE